jgi:hypothetical protein
VKQALSQRDDASFGKIVGREILQRTIAGKVAVL